MVFAVSECNSIETFESKHKQESFSALSSVTRWIDFFLNLGIFTMKICLISLKLSQRRFKTKPNIK